MSKVAKVDSTHFIQTNNGRLVSWSRDDGFRKYDNVSPEARDFHAVDGELYFIDTSLDGDHKGDLFSITPGAREVDNPTELGCVFDIDVFNDTLVVSGSELEDTFLHTGPQLSYLGDDGLLYKVIDQQPRTISVEGDLLYAQNDAGVNIFTVDQNWQVDFL